MKVRKGGFLHNRVDCVGMFCPEHNPSEHKMNKMPMNVRYDRKGLTERICPHGVGHPDPDSLAWLHRNGIDDNGTHGCCGCCG